MSNSASDPVNNDTSASTLASVSDLVVGIDHVGIAVADLDASAKWYLDNFGFENLHEEINEEQGVREAMVGPRGGDGALIQLLAPLNEQSTIAKFIDRNGPGLQQMAVRVTDLDAVSERLTAAGVRLLYPQPKRGTADSRINFVHPKDAGGVLLELVEPAASAH
jgi:methylmalonyl-CoA/ethylmalonyl-CoA epimerase